MQAREQVRRRLSDAVTKLEEPYRTTIWLRFFEDMPPRDVAAKMKVPVETVRTRTRRALEQLRQQLDEEYGDRRAWLAFAIPMARPAGIGLLTTAAGILMIHKTSIVLAAASLLLVALGTSSYLDSLEASPPIPEPPSTHKRVTLASPTQEPSANQQRLQLGASTTAAQATGPSGRVMTADHQPAPGLDYWLWRQPNPRQAWIPRQGSRLGHKDLVLGEPDGQCDTLGTWTAASPSNEELFGITVRSARHVFVSFSFAEHGHEVTLPEHSILRVRVEGAKPEDRWRLHAYPGLRDPEDLRDTMWASSYTLATQTASGRAIVHLQDQRASMRGHEIFETFVPRGQGFGVNVEGVGFAVVEDQLFVESPDVAVFHADSRLGVVEMKITREGKVAPVAGRINILHRASQFYTEHEFTAGQQSLSAALVPDRDYLCYVILHDGEQFERTLRISDSGQDLELTFERGTGRPRVELPLPEGVSDEIAAIVIEDREGNATRAVPTRSQFFSEEGAVYSFAISKAHVQLTFMPESWTRAYLCADDGRMWRIDRNTNAAVRIPSRKLPAQDLQTIRSKFGASPYGFFVFSMLWTDIHGKSMDIRLRRIRFDPATTVMPQWPLQKTQGFDQRFAIYLARERIALPF